MERQSRFISIKVSMKIDTMSPINSNSVLVRVSDDTKQSNQAIQHKITNGYIHLSIIIIRWYEFRMHQRFTHISTKRMS